MEKNINQKIDELSQRFIKKQENTLINIQNFINDYVEQKNFFLAEIGELKTRQAKEAQEMKAAETMVKNIKK